MTKRLWITHSNIIIKPPSLLSQSRATERCQHPISEEGEKEEKVEKREVKSRKTFKSAVTGKFEC